MASSVVESSENKKNENEGEKPRSGSTPGTNRHQLVQRLLDSSASLPAFINDLLNTQAVTVAGTEAAGFLLERQGEQATLRPIAHIRPDESSSEVRAAALAAFQDLIKPCVEQNRDGAIEVGAASPEGGEAQYCLITLLRAEGEIVAVSAVITRCMNVERARQRLMSMQLVAGYFELFTLRRNSEQSRIVAQSHQHVLQLATAVATAEGFESAGMNLCNELANRAHATRVSLGWVKGHKIKIVALSHTEQFDKKQELVVSVQKVMEECMDQEAVVQYDPNGKSSDNVTRDAAQLSRTQGGHIILSLPLRRRAEVIGVVTLEFLPQQKIGPQVASGLAIAVDLLAPQLYDRYENDRYLMTKVGISSKHVAEAAIGPKHMIAKLVAVAVVAAILFVTFFSPMYRVSSSMSFVTTSKYTLIAPKDGTFISDVASYTEPSTKLTRRIKPGDPVKKGQWLIKFDTHDLQVQRAKTLSDMESAQAEAEKARGEDKQADAKIADKKADSFRAQVDLLDIQIGQATITSPVDGYVLKGDLEDRIHDQFRFQKDSELMTVGRLDDLEAELSVAERDIQFLQVGQKGQVNTTSLPGDKYDVLITRIVPMANVDQKAADNTFKVYCKVPPNAPKTWRPGMAGEARIEIEKRPLYWIMSHRLVEYLQMKLWI